MLFITILFLTAPLPLQAIVLVLLVEMFWGTRWRSWLRHWATSRKVACL